MSKIIRIFLMVTVLMSAGIVCAQVDGTIILIEGGRKLKGTIQWSLRDKAYKIKVRGGNVELSIGPEKIQSLLIPKPTELTRAEELVRDGQAGQAIPILQKIISGYFKLNWDETATRLLADAYLAEGRAKEAIDVCEKIISGSPESAYIGDIAPAYWRALLMGDRVVKLENLLTKAVKEGDRATSAFALIARGDLILKSGNTNENNSKALRDGYLRVVTLYRGVKEAQPEALYKAAQCFEKLGQSSRADTMRSTLKSEHSSSEWARK